MKKEIIFELPSPYRDTMRIWAYKFGDYENEDCEKSLAVVGATRGNEAQQMFNCSQIIARLKDLESKGKIAEGKSIVVIPAINNFSINVEKRFWAMDNTDINRMFPGYDLGETTQRIAYYTFEYLKDYEYGIHFTSHYRPGKFIPHVRMMHTGYEDTEKAADFGLPYIYVRNSKPYDTTTLNYNWQIWGTKAFSLYIGATARINEEAGRNAVEAVMRFALKNNILKDVDIEEGTKSKLITSKNVYSVRNSSAGVLCKCVHVNDYVKCGELLGYILDPYEGTVRQKLVAPIDGRIFFTAYGPNEYEGSLVFRIAVE
ncbi:MAG: M14 family metallopeptidase [Clostridia bacterium]|nr:M14 family metallopeptidase [Clostridia bacterium]